MKRSKMSWRDICVAVLAILAFTSTRAHAAAKQVIDLNQGWRFHLAADSRIDQAPGIVPAVTDAELTAAAQWRPAQVPGLVQTDLLNNKLIPDPFYRDNESRLQWIGLEDWEYQTSFDVSPALLKRKHLELVFQGLDTYATVFLNGAGILSADNMFREWRVDVTHQLKPGANELRIVFRSPINLVLKRIEHDPYRLPTVGQIQAIAELGMPTDIYTRKAPYNYGWDWGPRFVTEGIWKPIHLEAWDDATIRDLHILQNEVTADVANLSANLEVVADADSRATVAVTYTPPNGKSATTTREVQLHAGENKVEVPLDIAKPDRWYPNGYGAQALYKFTADVKAGGSMQDHADVTTGLRSLELRRQPDQYGISFEFVVNGIPIFAKGADVIPFDSFPTRVTEADYRRILESARDAHMNMIRSWGGGYYETDTFFRLCDELGIMVWQDFMFGGGMYPGDEQFLDNVREEAIQNVKRLRNHPSLVLYCGNNEVEAAWRFWGDRIAWKNSLPPDLREKAWQDYMHLFSGVLAEVVGKYASPTPYWPSSPSANYDYPPGSQNSGDMHYWEVWHARAPIEDYKKQDPRFMSEYGFQSFPEMRTIETFSVPEDWDITTPVMLAHQKNVGGNERIHWYLTNYFGEPKDFPSFLYASQVMQAEAIKMGAEHLRRNRPRTMGSLYWQLNDCWPVASWASIDYYGRWKALQYYARRFYNDLLVSPDEENGALAVYIVSDRTTPTNAKLRVRLVDFSGKVLSDSTTDVAVPALSSKVYFQQPVEKFLNGSLANEVFVDTQLVVDGKPASRNLYFFRRPKDVTLPHAQITATLKLAGKGFRVHLTSPVLARDVYVSFGDLDATASDNYFDLLPGEAVDVDVTGPASLDQLRQSLNVISLSDAFQPPKTTVATQH